MKQGLRARLLGVGGGWTDVILKSDSKAAIAGESHLGEYQVDLSNVRSIRVLSDDDASTK
jgi:hypothetical protein